ncbi:MAG: methyl-accepting chemotaxis protein, partial [Ignavibacteria bacterium]
MMQTIKAKLVTLIAAALLALCALGGTAFYGMSAMKGSIDEIGTNRLPSVVGLFEMEAAAIEVRMTILSAAVYENDYKAQDRFSRIIEKLKATWAKYDKGFRLYEPLPQTKEEEVAWKQYEKEMADYKAAQEKTAGYIEQMTRNSDPKVQQSLFVDYYKSRDVAGPLFDKARTTLDRIIEMNVGYGNAAVKEGEDTAKSVKLMIGSVAAIAIVVAVLLGLFILRSTLAQLGGEPVYVTDVVRQVADGDLTVAIETKASDGTSMLFAIKGMVAKLSHIIGEVRGAADALSSASEEVSATAQSLSQASSEQAASVEETTASIEQMTASITQNTENAKVTDT